MDYLRAIKGIVDFTNEIRYENRFRLKTEHIVKEIFDYLKLNSIVLLNKNTELYRARIDSTGKYGLDGIPIIEMGAPPADLGIEGRINPVGMNCLYCASERHTAISEVRPWAGAQVTLAVGNIKRQCKLLMLHKNMISNPGDLTDHRTLFEISINGLFTSRHSPHNKIGYLPSQYIAEFIKQNNFDGISYLSSLSKSGNNIALFDTDDIEFKTTEVYKIQDVVYKYFDLNNDSEHNTFK